MSLTERDKQKFNQNLDRFRAYLDTRRAVSVEKRVEDLETLLFFVLLNEAGEIGITPELRELLKRVDPQLYQLFLDFLK